MLIANTLISSWKMMVEKLSFSRQLYKNKILKQILITK
ncbi:hypothetical protein VRK_37360 [Vibrio sp. MEBiC08052]|nr:hypothetical protein VRK_37360 [Vibrio sp. MEBiC08052]